MATKNLVPRATGEGQIGTTNKNWQHVFAVQGNFNQLKNTSNSDLLISENTNSLTITHDATNNQYKFNVLGGGGASTSGFNQYRLVVADGSDALSEANWEINDNHHLLPVGNSVSNLGAVDKKVANVYATTGIIDTVDTDAIKFDDIPNNEYFKIVIDGTNNKLQVKRYNDNDILQETKDLAYSSDTVSLGTSKLSALEDVTYPSTLAIDEFLISREVENGVIKFENKDAGSARTTLGLATNSNVEFGTLKLTASDSNNNGLGLDVVKTASFGDYTGDDSVIIDNGRGIYGKIADSSNIALTIGNNTNHKTKIQGELSLEKIRLNNNSALSILKYDNSATNQYVDLDGMKIQNIALPTDDADVANKVYVDSVASGLSLIASVKAATTAPFSTTAALSQTNEQNDTITLANGEGGFNSGTNKYIVDSIELAQYDRVLIKDKTTHNGSASFISNGVYTVGALDQATLTLTRATDFTAAALTSGASGAFVFVSQGTVNKGSGFVCHSLSTADTVGTHALLFTGFSSAGEFTGGNGITIDGTTIKTSLTGGTGITITDGASPSIAVDGVLAQLDALSPLAGGDDNGKFIVATGANTFNYQNGVTVRQSLGLGTSNNVTFNGLIAYNGGVKSKNYKIYNNAEDKHIELKTPLGNLNDTYTIQLPASKPGGTNKVLSVNSLQGNTATLVWADQSGGEYTPPNNSNYLGTANSTSSADGLLDTQIKTNATDISNNTTSIEGKQNSAQVLTRLSQVGTPSKNKMLVGKSDNQFEYINMNAVNTRLKFGLGEASTRAVYDGTQAVEVADLIAVIEENGVKKLPAIDGSNLTGINAASDLVLDTTPELGGDLDLNGKTIFNKGNNSLNLTAESINLGAIKSGQNLNSINKFDSTKSSANDTTNLFSKTGLSEGSILTSIVRISDDLSVNAIRIKKESVTNDYNGEFNVELDAGHGLSLGDIIYLGNLSVNNYNLSGLWMIQQLHNFGNVKVYLTPHRLGSNRNNRPAPNNFNHSQYNNMPKELYNIVNNSLQDIGEGYSILPKTGDRITSNSTDTHNGISYFYDMENAFLVKVSINFIKTLNETSLVDNSNPASYLLKRKTFVFQGSNFGYTHWDNYASQLSQNLININRADSPIHNFIDQFKNSASTQIGVGGISELKDDASPELNGDLDLLDNKIISSTSDTLLQNNDSKVLINSVNSTDSDAIGITAQAGGVSISSGVNKNVNITAQGTGLLELNSPEIKFGGDLNANGNFIYSSEKGAPGAAYDSVSEYSQHYATNINDRSNGSTATELNASSRHAVEMRSYEGGIRLWSANDKNIVLSTHGTGAGALSTGKGLVHIPGTLKVGTSSLFLTEESGVATLKVPAGETLKIVADDLDANNKGKVEIKGLTIEKDLTDNDNVKLSAPSGKKLKFADAPKIGEGTEIETTVPNKLTQNEKLPIIRDDYDSAINHYISETDIGRDVIFIGGQTSYRYIDLPDTANLPNGSYVKIVIIFDRDTNTTRLKSRGSVRPSNADRAAGIKINKIRNDIIIQSNVHVACSAECIWWKDYVGTGTSQNPQGTWLIQ